MAVIDKAVRYVGPVEDWEKCQQRASHLGQIWPKSMLAKKRGSAICGRPPLGQTGAYLRPPLGHHLTQSLTSVLAAQDSREMHIFEEAGADLETHTQAGAAALLWVDLKEI